MWRIRPMKLIAIQTSLECILYSGLCIYVWDGDDCYLLNYVDHNIKPYKLHTVDHCFELSSVNEVIRTLIDLTESDIDSLEIEITSGGVV